MKRLFYFAKQAKESLTGNKYFLDILIGFTFCISVYILSIQLDLYEKWSRLAAKYEKYEIDEIVFLLSSAIIALTYFSYKRYKELKTLSTELLCASNIDQLTGLKNRRGFLESAQERIESARINSKALSLIFIDLDRFKIINDTMGHNFGDLVLQHVSKILLSCTSPGDLICRHGGDEFIILSMNLRAEDATKLSQKILHELSHPLNIDGNEVFVSPSIGISLYPTHGENIEDLIKCADLAMYLAKDRGRNNFQHYTSSLSKKISKKMYIENGLRRALAKNEFIIYYQPQFNFGTNEVVGVEALLRWNHPELGLVLPSEFIPIAEETGLIVPIGNWVLENVCKQNKVWHEAGFSHIHMAVNISVQQLRHKDFIENVKKALNDSKLLPRYLELEITESIMQDINESAKILNELKKLGIKISIDDFGTGYSSLSILQYLPIDTLKIDHSFITGILYDLNTSAIVKTIIDMGRNLKLCVIAEGIECEKQANFLNENRCFLGQGYLFCKPLPSEEVLNMFKAYQSKGV